ncbi:MAG TPA: alpha/beta hydrolase [Ktedonobacteraceae bacterium]|nr:alpha/beta hydrolase [Ktedonobacteraceae bacterium]
MQTDKASTTQYLELSEGRIAFDDTHTAGPLVICVPGLGDVRAVYRFLVPVLRAAGYRVVTMDLRGHGESSTGWSDYRDTTIGNDVLALVRHLNAGPAILMGNSYGGAAVTYAAAMAPDSVAGLVLLDAFVHDLPQTLMQRLAIWAVARLGAGAWTSYYKSLYVSKQPPDMDTYLAALKANLRERGRFAATRAMMYGSHATVEAHLDQVKAPTLIVMGSKDPDFPDPAGEARFTAEKLSGAASTNIQMIEGAGHYPYAEMPERVQAVLLPFLQEIKEKSRHDA